MKIKCVSLLLISGLFVGDCAAWAESGASTSVSSSTSDGATTTTTTTTVITPTNSAGTGAASVGTAASVRAFGHARVHMDGDIHVGGGSSLTISNVSTQLMGINGSAIGNRSGGRFNIRVTADDAPLLTTRWTFRHLRDCAIQYPAYFYTTSSDGTRLLNTWTSGGYRPMGAVAASPEPVPGPVSVNDWYGGFPERVIGNFFPKVRGGIGIMAKLSQAGVDSVSFFGYKYDIPFERGAEQAPPPAEPGAADEAELKESITSALRKAVADYPFVVPVDTKSIEVKMFFAGDPVSRGGCWTSWYLLDHKYFKASE